MLFARPSSFLPLLALLATTASAHSPVNIINSTEEPWFLVVEANKGGFCIQTEHNPDGYYQKHCFGPGQEGRFELTAQSVFSLEATDDKVACEVRFDLLDHLLDRPSESRLVYFAPALHAPLPGHPSLRYFCSRVDLPCVQPVLRQPNNRILHLLKEGWCWNEPSVPLPAFGEWAEHGSRDYARTFFPTAVPPGRSSSTGMATPGTDPAGSQASTGPWPEQQDERDPE